MALVKCKECGNEVSTTAKSCPKCGAKPRKRTSLVTWVVLAFVIFVIYAASQGPSSTSTTAGSSSSRSPAPASSSTVIAVPKWESSTSTDEMTGKRQSYASSPTVRPAQGMEFPYHDVTAWLGIGCDGKSEWAYIGFSESPNLTDTETEDGYNAINTRIKWNDSVQNVALSQAWGASFIHFDNDRDAISKIVSSTSVLLELKWYGQQSTHFKFSLEGASTAVQAMRAKCAK